MGRLTERYITNVNIHSLNVHLKFFLDNAIPIKFDEGWVERHKKTGVYDPDKYYLFTNGYIFVCKKNKDNKTVYIITVMEQSSKKLGKEMIKI